MNRNQYGTRWAARIRGGTAMLALAALVAIIGPASPSLAAESACGTRSDIIQTLAQQYAEAPVAIGLIDPNTVFEVFARLDGDSWTIVISRSSGTSCVVGAGRSWQFVWPETNGPKA